MASEVWQFLIVLLGFFIVLPLAVIVGLLAVVGLINGLITVYLGVSGRSMWFRRALEAGIVTNTTEAC